MVERNNLFGLIVLTVPKRTVMHRIFYLKIKKEWKKLVASYFFLKIKLPPKNDKIMKIVGKINESSKPNSVVVSIAVGSK